MKALEIPEEACPRCGLRAWYIATHHEICSYDVVRERERWEQVRCGTCRYVAMERLVESVPGQRPALARRHGPR